MKNTFTYKLGLAIAIIVCCMQTPLHTFSQSHNDYFIQVGGGYSVRGMALKGDTLIIGGDFDCVGFHTSSMVSINQSTSATTQVYPFFNKAVRDVLPDGSGGYYVCGDFGYVNGYQRRGLAHIKADKTLDLSWDINVNDGASIYAMLLSPTGTTLWVAGNFTSIGNTSTKYIAAIDVNSRTVNASWGIASWPSGYAIEKNWWANIIMCALAYYPGDGSNPARLIVGGDFFTRDASWNGSAMRRNLISLNPATGALIPSWRCDLKEQNKTTGGVATPIARSLVIHNNDLYVGGVFAQVTDGANYTANNKSLAKLDVRNNGSLFAYNIGIVPIPSEGVGYVNRIKWVEDGSGKPRLAIGGKFDGISGYSATESFLIYEEGYGPAYYTFGTQVNGRVLNATSVPGVYDFGEVFDFELVGTTAYLAGDFDFYQGNNLLTALSTRRNLLALNMNTNAVVPTFNPAMQTDLPVYSIYLSGGEIVTAGAFTTSNVQYRKSVAAIDIKNKIILPMNPGFNSYVNRFEFSPDKDTLYIAGNFTQATLPTVVNRAYVAAYRFSTNQLLNWGPTSASGGGVEDIKLDPVRHIIYAGGKFTAINGASRRNLAALSSLNGALFSSWTADVAALNTQITPVRSLAISPGYDTLFVGGRYTTMNVPAAAAATSRQNLAALRTTMTSTVVPYDGTATLLAWNYPVQENPVTPPAIQDVGVNSVVVDNNMSRLYVGGRYVSLGGKPAVQNLGAIRLGGGVDETFTPVIAGGGGGVEVVLPVSGVLFFGGNFGTVNGIAKSNAAAINAVDATLVSVYEPYPARQLGGTIISMLYTGQYLFLGGNQETMTSNYRDNVYHIATAANLSTSLPIQLKYFTATKLQKACLLQWGVNEDAERVEVQRSTDGINFSTIATYTSSQTTHKDNSLQQGTTYYYRLRISESGGHIYSPIRRIDINGNNEVQVPAWLLNNNVFRIVTPGAGYKVMMYTSGGQLLLRQRLKGGLNDIYLPGYSRGAIFYVIEKDGTTATGKLVIQ